MNNRLVGLLRHGEVEGGPCFRGSTDDPLTATGLKQMQAATTEDADQDHPGNQSGEQHWERVITSPLQRCAAFARVFAQQHSLPLTFDEQIKEMHFGTWEGRTAAELNAADPDALARFWDDPDGHPPPHGESLSHFQARVLAAWNNIIHHYPEQKILLVTHAGVIRILLCHLQQRPISKLLQIEVKHGALHNVQITVDAHETITTKLIAQG